VSEKTTALSPACSSKSPKGINPLSSLITPDIFADFGNFKSLIFVSVTLESGFTINSIISASTPGKLAIAETLPFLTYLNMLLAAIIFLLIRVSIPIACDKFM